MHYLPVFGLGIFLALAGLAMFMATLLKAKAAPAKAAAPLKKSEQRELAQLQAVKATDTKKLRIAGAVCVAVGATLIVLS